MNKKLILILAGILLISIVLAEITTNYSQDIILTKNRKTALSNMGLTKPILEELKCDGKVCTACAYQIEMQEADDGLGATIYIENKIGAGCIEVADGGTDEQLKAKALIEMQKNLERIADVEINRSLDTKLNKLGTGEYTIK